MAEIMVQLIGRIENMDSIGIKNVYRRLMLYYGDFCIFIIESKRNRGMTVKFTIPLEMEHK